jgi:hypothetical protein
VKRRECAVRESERVLVGGEKVVLRRILFCLSVAEQRPEARVEFAQTTSELAGSTAKSSRAHHIGNTMIFMCYFYSHIAANDLFAVAWPETSFWCGSHPRHSPEPTRSDLPPSPLHESFHPHHVRRRPRNRFQDLATFASNGETLQPGRPYH